MTSSSQPDQRAQLEALYRQMQAQHLAPLWEQLEFSDKAAQQKLNLYREECA